MYFALLYAAIPSFLIALTLFPVIFCILLTNSMISAVPVAIVLEIIVSQYPVPQSAITWYDVAPERISVCGPHLHLNEL